MEDSGSTRGVRCYEDLIVWQRALELAEAVSRATAEFPRNEIYGLTSQLRRAAVSVVSNIAEGHERNTRGEFIQFLGQARGSLAEVDTQVRLAFRLELISEESSTHLTDRIAEVGRLLNGLRRSLAQK